MSKEYLGDSVYIQSGSFCYTLTTENGFGPNNAIHLEPQIILAMMAYIKKHNPELWEQLQNGLR